MVDAQSIKHSRTIVAWGDESARQRATPPFYYMCATVFEDDGQEVVQKLKHVKPKRMRKLHWHDMSPREKRDVLDAMVSVQQWSTVVLAVPLSLAKQERARRKCLEVLLPKLEERGVGLLNLESRWKQEDESDMRMVAALYSRRMIHKIKVAHVRGTSEEARLWVPDIILGAIGDLLSDAPGSDTWHEEWNATDNRVVMHLATP